MEIDIRVFEPPYDKREFYSLMGDALSMKEVRREIPYLYNEPGRIWFVVLSSGELIAFGGLQISSGAAEIMSMYTFPAYRRQGLMSALLDEMLDYEKVQGMVLKVVCRVELSQEYGRRGFTVGRKSKNYVWMVRK